MSLSSRSSSSLKDKIDSAIRVYYTQISFWKVTGKERAKEYLQDIAELSDEQLIQKLYWDIAQKNGKGYLDTSDDLRKKLAMILLSHVVTGSVRQSDESLAAILNDIARATPIQKKSLKQTLVEFIDHYLRCELSFAKQEGKLRAENFKIEVLNFSAGEKELTEMVYSHICEERGKGMLATSTDLRYRLKQALCEFYGLNKVIDEALTRELKSLAKSLNAYASAVPNARLLKANIIDRALRGKMETLGIDVEHMSNECGQELQYVSANNRK